MKGYVLENKLGISNSTELHREEERITKLKAIDIWEKNLLKSYDPLSLDSLYFIHEYLFYEIYEFAGKTRNVDISKGNTQFCLVRHIEYMKEMIKNKKSESIEDIIELYIEINLLHPFREGNGRSSRIWLDNVLNKKFNCVIDWSKITSSDYLSAIILSGTNDSLLKKLLIDSMTNEVDNKEIYFRCLDKSYEYEEQFSYSSKELYNNSRVK